jgi:serine/threonine protein kinase
VQVTFVDQCVSINSSRLCRSVRLVSFILKRKVIRAGKKKKTRRKEKGGKSLPCYRPPREIPKIFRQVMQGLQSLHDKGIAHRDIKAENVLTSKDENGLVTEVKVFKNEARSQSSRC